MTTQHAGTEEYQIPAFDVVWESDPNTYAVRNVQTGELIISTDYSDATRLANKWNVQTRNSGT